MDLEWLEFALHDNTLLEEFGKPRHYKGVEHVDLQVEAVSNVITIEWHGFTESDPCHEFGIFGVGITAVAHCQSMINRQMKPVYIGTD